MRKFAAGVVVGWLCSDIITNGLKEVMKFIDNKVDGDEPSADQAKTEEPKPGPEKP